MDIVVFDLETQKTFKKGQVSGIVEIGAVKLKNDSMIIKETFQRIVIPPSGKINKTTRKMMGITKEQMYNEGVSFPDAIFEFIKWIGKDYFLCSWSDSDIRILIREFSYHSYPMNWIKNYNDVQLPLSKALGSEQRLSLKRALQAASIKKEGKFHSGISDAINTSKIMRKYKNYFQLETNKTESCYRSIKTDFIVKCKKCDNNFQRKNNKQNLCSNCIIKRRKDKLNQS